MELHLFWSGPFPLNQISQLRDEEKHYGIYQVYGHHPLYGNNVLLYIGKADQQTFGKRIAQEEWEFDVDPGNTSIYIGQLGGKEQPTNDEWSVQIDLCEKLLIYAHNPIYNRSSIYSIPEDQLKHIHVFNWYSYRDLFPEVSGKRFTSVFDDITEDNIYTYRD